MPRRIGLSASSVSKALEPGQLFALLSTGGWWSRLRNNHDCVHRWRYVSGGGNCDGCGHYLRLFLFVSATNPFPHSCATHLRTELHWLPDLGLCSLQTQPMALVIVV